MTCADEGTGVAVLKPGACTRQRGAPRGVECEILEGGDGTLHFWQVPGAGREGKCVRSGAGGSGDGDAGGGGVRGGAWVPVGAECAALLPAFAMEGCGGV